MRGWARATWLGPARRGGRRLGSSGFTLVELVLSMAMASIIMGALGSAIMVAARAIPAGRTKSMEVLAAAQGLDQLSEELRYAVNVSVATPTVLEFSVADRDGDGEAETIRYEWSGTPGAPLTRVYNGASPTTVIERVNALEFTYRRKGKTESRVVTTKADSGEVLFSAFSTWIGTLPLQTATNLTTANWTSQAFTIDRVSLPADATNIRITRVGVRLKRPSSGGAAVTVGVHRRAGVWEPMSAPIGTPTRVEFADIPSSPANVDVRMNDVVLSGPSDTSLAIVVKGTTSSASAQLSYYNLLLAPADSFMLLWSTNSGGSWLPSSSGERHKNDSPFYVYGKYESTSTVTLESVSYALLGASADVIVGTTEPTRIRTTTVALNKPEAPAP